MALQIPTVNLKADGALIEPTAKFQTVHSDFDMSVLATKSLAGILGVIDDFKVRKDTTTANEARIELSQLNATAQTEFDTYEHNPDDSTFDKVTNDVNAKRDKILEKYNIDGLDWRVRSRFYDDYKKDVGTFNANIQSDIYVKRYKADIRTITSQLSYALNEAQVHYNNPEKLKEISVQIKEGVEARGKLEGWDPDTLKYNLLNANSTKLLGMGLTANEKGDYEVLNNIVKNEEPNMLGEHWRQLNALKHRHDAELSVKRANIDPVTGLYATVDHLNKSVTHEQILDYSRTYGMSEDEARRAIYATNFSTAYDMHEQQKRKNNVDYAPVEQSLAMLKEFKDHPEVQKQTNPRDQLNAAICVAHNIPTDGHAENVDPKVFQSVTTLTNAALSYPDIDRLILRVTTGVDFADNPTYNKENNEYVDANIQSIAELDLDSLKTMFIQKRFSTKSINYTYSAIAAFKNKQVAAKERSEFTQCVDTWTSAMPNYKPNKGEYGMLLPDVAKDQTRVSQREVGNYAHKVFMDTLVGLLADKKNKFSLAQALHSLRNSGELLIDKDGNPTQLLKDAIEKTQQAVINKFNFHGDYKEAQASKKPILVGIPPYMAGYL